MWADAWRRLRNNRAATAAGGILLVMVALCVLIPELHHVDTLCELVPALRHWDYSQTNLSVGPTPPSAAHWMGTDYHGRDLMARVFFGPGARRFGARRFGATGLGLSLCGNAVDCFP